MEVAELFLRIALSFLTLLLLTRIMGRKEISQMTFFNFTSAIAIGSIAASLVLNPSVSIRNGLIALVGWTIFTLVMGFIDLKSKVGRKWLTGDPVIVIKNGEIVERALRSSRLDLDSLNALLRQKNIFSVADVDYAIFETNGQLSVIPKEQKQPVSKEDMKIVPEKKVYPIPTEIVSDGKIVTENLKKLKLDASWVKRQLEQAGVRSLSDCFFAQVQTDGSLIIHQKKKE